MQTSEPMTVDAFDSIRALMGDVPFHPSKEADADKKVDEIVVPSSASHVITKNIVLKDGTYASVTSSEAVNFNGDLHDSKLTHLRKLVCAGDILLGTVTCVCLTKLALRTKQQINRLTAESVMTIAGVGKLAEVKRGSRIGVYSDCLERLTQCARILMDPALKERSLKLFLASCHTGIFLSISIVHI